MKTMSTTRMLVGLAAAGLVAAGSGSAFTNSNTLPLDSVAGYGTTTVSGATATSVLYDLSANGTEIETATVVFSGDVTDRTVKAGFGTAALTACNLGTHDALADTTTATCSFTGVSTSAATSFAVAVTETPPA